MFTNRQFSISILLFQFGFAIKQDGHMHYLYLIKTIKNSKTIYLK